MTERVKLSGLIDRELDQAERTDIETLVTGDPESAALVSRMRRNDDLVRAAFAVPMGEDVPDRFTSAIDAGLNRLTQVHVASAVAGNDNRPRWWQLGGAVAASLAIGLVMGTQFLASGEKATTSVALSKALSTTPSLQTVKLASGEQVTPELTIAQNGGGYCRQFRLASADRDHAGVACRTQGQWVVEAIAPATPTRSASDDYVTAEGAQPSSVEDVIAARRIGDPLDPAAEKVLIARRWR
jgi:hypothetical protein